MDNLAYLTEMNHDGLDGGWRVILEQPTTDNGFILIEESIVRLLAHRIGIRHRITQYNQDGLQQQLVTPARFKHTESRGLDS